jgi:hypothetical protein
MLTVMLVPTESGLFSSSVPPSFAMGSRMPTAKVHAVGRDGQS